MTFEKPIPASSSTLPVAANSKSSIQPDQAPGRLTLPRAVLPPRRIALNSMPRLHVVFSVSDSIAAQRLAFLRYFDFYMQRDGG